MKDARFLALAVTLIGLFLTSGPSFAQVDDTPWHIEVEWEVGGADSDLYFSFPNEIVIGNDDQVYISDRRETHIQVLSRTGESLFTIGGQGQGPGEFSEVTSMLAMPEGGILVQDRRNGVLTQFDSDGEVVRSIKIPEISTRIRSLIAYDAATDHIAFLKDHLSREIDKYMVFEAGLGEGSEGNGVFKPAELLDTSDPVWAFSASSVISYGHVSLQSGGATKLVIYPTYYNAAWVSIDFRAGRVDNVQSRQPAEANKLPHGTKLNITDEEFKASRGEWGSAVGVYTQQGIFFADIHNWAVSAIPLGEEQFGVFFNSEETGMDGQWADVHSMDGSLLGRHPINHSLPVGENNKPGLRAGRGMEEVYLVYYDADRTPIVARGRLVAGQ